VQFSDSNAEAKLEVKPDEATSVDITLASNAIVIGKVVDAPAQPIAEQRVALVLDGGDACRSNSEVCRR
jgi:hypothetical protein